MNKDKLQKAVALKYDPENKQAPYVTAKGTGKTAEKIIETAQKHNVSVKEDHTLSHLLYELEINEQIPYQLYPIIAEIFAMIYETERKAGALSDGK